MNEVEVVVPKLHKRKAPVNDTNETGNVAGIVKQGYRFESVGIFRNEAGEWHLDKDGYYYWGGGLDAVRGSFTAPESGRQSISASEPNHPWLDFLNIAEIWEITKGKNATVAVLDTGINMNIPGLVRRMLKGGSGETFCKNFLDGSSDVADKFGHGSHCASLIGFDNTSNLIAVAPECNLVIGKISEFGAMDDYRILAEAISWAAHIDEVDIISISFGMGFKDSSLWLLHAAVQLAVKRNKVIVAAIGDKDIDNRPAYPAALEECISVGACTSAGSYWSGNVVYEKTNVYAPGTDIISNVAESVYFPNGNTQTYPLSGTSQAAAITSGVVALIVSHLKSQNRSFTPGYIKDIVTKYSRGGGGGPLLHPKEIFNQL